MIRNEIRKLFTNPYMWGVLLFCVVMNCVVMIYGNAEDFKPEQYKDLWQQFLLEDANISDEITNAKDKVKEYKQSGMEEKEKLYDRFAKELESTNSYKGYRQEILDNAKNASLFTFFSENSYAKKNIEKTASHFKKMRMIETIAEPSLGIEKIFTYKTGIIVLFLILFLGYLLFIKESEAGVAGLLYVTRFGKKRLFLTKVTAHIVGTAVATIAIYGCNYLILQNQYGIGSWNRSIQSVFAYRSCGMELSVGEFLFFGINTLMVIMLVLTVFIDFICVCGKNTLPSIMLFFTCVLLCIIVYVEIPMNSTLNCIKYLDPIFLLNVGEILGKYVNINIFGNPVSYLVVVVVIYSLVLLFSLLIGMFEFSRLKEGCRKKKILRRFFRNKDKRIVLGYDSLFRYEMYKVIKGGKIIIVFALFLIISIFYSYQSHLVFEDEDEYYYYTYMKKLDGEKTTQKNDYIKKEKEKFQVLKQKQEKMIEEEKTEDLMVISEELRPIHGFEKLLEREEYLNKNNINAYVYEGGYERLMNFSKNKDNNVLMIIGMLLLTFSLCSVFTQDHEIGQKMLLQATLHGRKRIVYNKIFVSMTIVLFSFLIIWGPQFLVYYRLYGLNGIGESIKCIGVGENIGGPIWLWMLLGYGVRLGIMIAYSGFFLYISNKLKRMFISIISMSLIIAILFFVFI